MPTVNGETTSETTTGVTVGVSMTLTCASLSTTTTATTVGSSMTLTGSTATTTTTTAPAVATVTPYDEEADMAARTAVTYDALLGNSSLTDPAGTALSAANDHVIVAAKPEQTVLRVTNTHDSAHDITIKAGDYPPALAAGLGDLVVTVPLTSGVMWIGPFESGRFLQSDGSMLIDVETNHAGTITAFLVPRGV